MNLICNNCGGAYLYKLLNKPYSNPFMWCCIFSDDMLRLISEYEHIDFNKYKLIQLTKDIADYNNYTDFRPNMFGIELDSKVKVFYTHYLAGYQKTPTTIGPDVFYFRNYVYVYNKFVSRLQRFLKSSAQPSFMVLTYRRHGWTSEKIQHLLAIRTKYKMAVITDEPDAVTDNPSTTILHVPDLNVKYKFPAEAIHYNLNGVLASIGEGK